MKSGFVNIFGKPNAGKSTLLNSLLGEKLAIVSPKVQTTRHRIKGFITTPDYQIIFSDTPGIIEPKYKLHEKMMGAVKEALQDADVALFLHDLTTPPEASHELFAQLRLKVPVILVCNKSDLVKPAVLDTAKQFFSQQWYGKEIMVIAAIKPGDVTPLIEKIVQHLPHGMAFYPDDDITDLPTRFFVAELIREKIYELYEDEIPYHTTVLVREYKDKISLVKIQADIIVQRDSQKGILLGGGGKQIKALGTASRLAIEQFIGKKVFLELFVKIKPKWRDSDLHLKEYGYY